MVIFIKSFTKSLPAGASETEIGSLTVKVGRKYAVLEILPYVITGSWLYVYIENERVAEIHGDVISKDNRRILVNWELSGGQTLKITATNATASGAIAGAIVVYDDLPA